MRTILIGAAIFLAAGAGAVHSAPMRLIFQAPLAKSPVPTRFVIDARTEPGDGEFQTTVKGWFAALPPDPPASGEVEGTCVEARCGLKVSLDDGELNLTGDFGAAQPGVGRYRLAGSGDTPGAEGAVNGGVIAGPIVGLGELAPQDAVSGPELLDLLAWNGSESGKQFGADDPKAPPEGFERESLAVWQGAKGRPMTGLILAGELDELRAGAQTARRAAGWTAIADLGPGISAAYPATVLPHLKNLAAVRRFETVDGHAWLEIATGPALNSEAFDALVDRLTADDPARKDVNYTRVNDYLELRYEKTGQVTLAVYHSLPRGLVRLEFAYPAAQAARFEIFEGPIDRAFQVVRDPAP